MSGLAKLQRLLGVRPGVGRQRDNPASVPLHPASDGKMLMLYKGSCHCGKVAFEVKGEIGMAVRCNCSICSRKGALLWAVPHEKLNLVAWGDDLGRYTFGKVQIAHRFCRTCGIHPFAEVSAKATNGPPISTSTASTASTSPASKCSSSTAARLEARINSPALVRAGPMLGRASGLAYSAACLGPIRNATSAASKVATPP